MGSIYHQYVGAPVNESNVEPLERAIEAGVRVQPFVEDVRVRIDRSKIKAKRGAPYKYYSITGDMLEVWLRVRYMNAVAECEMKYLRELRYPLMRIVELRE
ncbi:MAG TPA: dihydroneopterin aldolase family protein [Thermoplasmata archaeon]|nr:dihydroneopterin aldolase family protein [Thermoplasmata archaeon]